MLPSSAVSGDLSTSQSEEAKVVLRLENASEFADSLIEELVRFAKPSSQDLPGFVLKISDTDAYAIRKVREWRRKKLAREVERAYGATSLLFSGILKRLSGVLAQLLGRARAKK